MNDKFKPMTIEKIFIQIGRVTAEQVKLERYFKRKNDRLQAVKQMYIDMLNDRERQAIKKGELDE
jgi:hypothetical protein